jgi:hypothetical protein
MTTGVYWRLTFRGIIPGGAGAAGAGKDWLGDVITEAATLTDAIAWLHVASLNPGGTAAFQVFTATRVDPGLLDRLIPYDEMLQIPPPEGFCVLTFTPELAGGSAG